MVIKFKNGYFLSISKDKIYNVDNLYKTKLDKSEGIDHIMSCIYYDLPRKEFECRFIREVVRDGYRQLI